jgi:hypothetical protein
LEVTAAVAAVAAKAVLAARAERAITMRVTFFVTDLMPAEMEGREAMVEIQELGETEGQAATSSCFTRI